MQNQQTGFTLIELMIAIAIVGILAAVAVPQYGKYMTEARRTDAHISLRAAAQSMERCRTRKFSYADCTVDTTSAENYYTLKLDSAARTFTVTATATAGSSQANDTDCSTMTINQQGVTTSAKADNSATTNCW